MKLGWLGRLLVVGCVGWFLHPGVIWGAVMLPVANFSFEDPDVGNGATVVGATSFNVTTGGRFCGGGGVRDSRIGQSLGIALQMDVPGSGPVREGNFDNVRLEGALVQEPRLAVMVG